MLTIYDSHHIPTNRCVPGRRACRSHTGVFAGGWEARRVRQESIALINRRLRFVWLVRQWAMHEERYRLWKEIHP